MVSLNTAIGLLQEDLQLRQENGTMQLVGLVDMGEEDVYMRAMQSGMNFMHYTHCLMSGENYQEREPSVEYLLPMICTRKIYF